MLNDLAVAYIYLPRFEYQLLHFTACVLGGLIAGVTVRSAHEMARAPYFAYLSVVFLVVVAVQGVWLASVPAIDGGYFWVLAATTIGAQVGLGFYTAKLSIARSRDAYGHPRMAFLAFVPIANFWLLLKRSRNHVPNQPFSTHARISVVAGCTVILLACGVSFVLARQIERTWKDESFCKAVVQSWLRLRGVESTLRWIVSEAKPHTVDEFTTFESYEVNGNELSRTYVIRRPVQITDAYRVKSIKVYCSDPRMSILFSAGVRFRETWLSPEGASMAVMRVSPEDCGL